MAILTATTATACQGAQGVIILSQVGAGHASYYWTVVDANNTDYGGAFDPASLPLAVEVPNGDYTVRVYADDNGSLSASTVRTYTLACAAGGGGGGCDLVLLSAMPTAPTTADGLGSVAITYSTSSASSVDVDAVHATTGYVYSSYVGGLGGLTGGSGVLPNLPSGEYALRVLLDQQQSCQATGTFTIADGPPAPDPSLAEPARWEPVGGVLPNPVRLKVEANLTDALGAPRPGLHVEVELWRPGATAAFATFRATVRAAVQYVDAAPYLRAELVAAQRYPATSSSPLIDSDACLRFCYRFRVVDGAGAEPWQTRAGERHAVLAALPRATDTMARYVADGTGYVASSFRSGEAVQFVGFPLEVSVLLPLVINLSRFVEWRYLDQAGQEVEIRSYALSASLPAGYLRISLPANPPLAAASVEVAVVDTDRSTTSLPGEPGFLLTDNGRLKL